MKPPTTKNTLFVLAFLFCSFAASGQEFEMKFGKIDPSNLEMESYEKDTSAVAMVIGDFGDIRVSYLSGSFKVLFERHLRIKIFKKEGYSWADNQIRLYTSGRSTERLSRLKGATYNLADGKMEKSKLKKKAIFRENESRNVESVKFTMPDVKEGSIIDFQYIISSDFLFNLPEWQFQRSIPVLWSEYNVSVPDYYIYKKIVTGYETLDISDINTSSGSIILDPKTNDVVNFTNNNYRMVAIDLPPFVTEPMLTTAKNYILKAKFEIASESFPNSPLVLYTESWESINNKLLERDDFYGQLSKGNFLKDPIDEINSSITDPFERVKACYEYVKGHMKWDDYNGKYISSTLRSAYNDQSGTAADINLMLVSMLREAGFNSCPVILSTRSNGLINPFFPLLSTFNYVIARVEVDGRFYLLDATDPFATFSVLPRRCLNGRGRIVDEPYSDWQDIRTEGIYNYKCDMKLELNSEGDFTGSMVNDRVDYAAYMLRKMIENEKSEEDFIESIENSNSGLEIESFEYLNLDDVYKPAKEVYEVKITGESDIAGDMIYFNPFFYERVENNPFKLEDRKYPIDFAYPLDEAFTLSIKIPEGYSVEELPENLSLILPEGAATFNFSISQSEGEITLSNEFRIGKPVFMSDEYQGLKDFYDQIVSKHSEMVVLKKN